MVVEVVYNVDVEQKMVRASQLALQDVASLYIKLLIGLIKREGGYDTGEMVNSIVANVVSGGNRVEVVSQTAQAVIMEFGRGANKKRPPMEALVGWANRKGIVQGSSMGDMDSKEKGILYVMAKSIGEKGIAPRHYFQRTYDMNARELEKYYTQRFTYYMQL